MFEVRNTGAAGIWRKAFRWIGFSVLLATTDNGPAQASGVPVIIEHRGIRMEAVPNSAAVTAADSARSVAPEKALARLREALDRIYGNSPLSASKIELLKRNGRVVMIYDPAFPKERLASVTIAAFFPDYYQHQGDMKDFVVVVGRYGIKWPRDKLAAIIVHELVGHGLQHLRGRIARDRRIDLECEARLYEEAAYQDLEVPRATPDMIRFRKDMKRNWCADFRLFMRRHDPRSMALWNYGTPRVPDLLALFEDYLGHLRATGVAGRAVSASAEKRHRDFLAFAKQAERAREPTQLFVVGKKYLHGVGVSKDAERARDWFRKSAENGYMPAQQVLGEMAEKGVGAPPNIKDAFFWYKLAARHGSEVADGRAHRLEPQLSSRQRSDALGRVARWLAASGR